jgi:hypothetical protein
VVEVIAPDPGYFTKLLEWLRANPIPAGTVRHLTFEHADHCLLLGGYGNCSCDPTIRLGLPTPTQQRANARRAQARRQ